MKGVVSAWDMPRPSCQYKGDLFAAESQRIGNKRQKQEIEKKGERIMEQEEGKGIFVLAAASG